MVRTSSGWINTTLKTTIAPEGWSEWHIAPKLFAEYNTMDADGQPVDLNNRRTTYKVDDDKLAPGETSPVTRQAILSAEEAAKYTYEAVIFGNDDWNPRKFFEPVEAPAEVVYANGKLTWKAVPYAICYLVIDAEGNVVGMTKDDEYAISAPAYNRVIMTNKSSLLLGDFIISTDNEKAFIGTCIQLGSPDFKCWEDVETYFSRIRN